MDRFLNVIPTMLAARGKYLRLPFDPSIDPEPCPALLLVHLPTPVFLPISHAFVCLGPSLYPSSLTLPRMSPYMFLFETL